MVDFHPPPTLAEINTDAPVDPHTPALFIDITAKVCPMTFVHTRLALDRLVSGDVLAVRLRGDEPRRNVPRTAAEQGHAVLAVNNTGDGDTLVLIRKK